MTEEKTVAAQKQGRHSRISTVLQMIALVAALSVLAFWGIQRTVALLNGTLERSVARQAADMSVIAQERFDRELSELTLAANHLAMGANEAEMDHMLASLRGTSGGMSVGLLSIHGDAIRGAALSRWLYWSLPRAYRGQNVVDYYSGRGLLFAVPVIRNGNVRAVLYRLYDSKGLADRFTLTDYNPAVRLLILDRVGNLIIPYKNYGESDEAFFNDGAVRQAFGQIRDHLGTRRSAASYIERDGERYFLFASDLPKANCTVAGYIPWSAVAGDISRVHERLLRSIGVLLLIFFAVGRYIFSVRRKAAESESLRREKAAANLANRAKSEFLANMSHEIRTPINAVLGMNEMILREGKDPVIDRYARNIRAAGRSLLDIVNDVLDFSKIESGKIEIVNGEYSLSELIRTAANMTRPRAESKGLTLNLEIEPAIPDRLIGDSTRVQQIMVNLLTNAAKYTERGGIDLIVSHDRAAEKNITLRITVRDTGIGIREEDKPKLFQGFERLDAERNRGVEGTGLGLAITKRLAVLMGGDVTFESTYGKGTTFFVTLPQEAVGTETVADAAARSHESETHHKAYRASFIAPDAEVLVADDNELNLFVVEGLLKNTQIKIDAVTSGTAALERLAAKRYDAVLLDHRMPGPDGVETLHRAKELPNAKGIPFLILTADAFSDARDQFLAEGFDDYLSKPVDGEALEQTLARYLPPEKVHPAPKDDAEPEKPAETQEPAEPAEDEKTQESGAPLLDESAALHYCGGNLSLYKRMSVMFADLYPKKRKLFEEAFAHEDWHTYTIYAHALKSSSLTVGSRRLSTAAKEAEARGKRIQSPDADEAEKAEALAYLKSRHEGLMEMYDELAKLVRQRTKNKE